MIDIWKSEGERNVRLTSTDGRIVEGNIACVSGCLWIGKHK